MKIKIAALIIIVAISGCATAPMTFEERLNSKDARDKPYGISVSKYKRTRYAWHQAINAMHKLNQSNSEDVQTKINPLDSIGSTDLLVADLAAGNEGFVGMILLSTLIKERLTNRSTSRVTVPGIAYYKITDESSRVELNQEFAAAKNLFNRTFNQDGTCLPVNWTSQAQFAKANVFHEKDAYYHIEYECTDLIDSKYMYSSPLDLTVYSDPLDGYASITAIEFTCQTYPYDKTLPLTQANCGRDIYQAHHEYMAPLLQRGDWLRVLVFESDDPGKFLTEYHFKGNSLVTDAYPLTPRMLKDIEQHAATGSR